jgi:hypothetical protein
MTVRPPPDNLNDLPLFASAREREARQRRPFPWHVRAVARRNGVTLQHAATICPLAGIGPETVR